MFGKAEKQSIKNTRKLYNRAQRPWQLQNATAIVNNEASKWFTCKTKQTRQSWAVNEAKNNAKLPESRIDKRYMENKQDPREQGMLKKQFSLLDNSKSKRIENKYKNRK